VPANGVLFSAVIIDDNGVIMGDADVASVNLGVVTLSSSNYSGKQLKVNYAYGSMASQIQVVYDQINERIDAVVGPAPEDMNTLKELADAVTNLSTTLDSASTSSTEASNYVNTVLV
jgi:predicted ATP-grasp superfamily ATP-dependent carboligase